MPASMAPPGDRTSNGSAVHQHFARVGGRQAEHGLRQLGAARSDKPREPDDFAAANLERHILYTGRSAGDAAQLERDLSERHAPLRKDRRQLASDHQVDQRRALQAGARVRADRAAVAQHGDAIGNRENLFEPVRDVDDADLLGLQPRDDLEEPLHLRPAQRRRRLVHDEHSRGRPNRLRNLDELLLRHAEAVDQPIGVEVGAHTRQQVARLAPSAAPVDAAPRRSRLERERDVLGDRQVRKQRRLLVDGSDAERARHGGTHRRDRPAGHGQGSRVGGARRLSSP